MTAAGSGYCMSSPLPEDRVTRLKSILTSALLLACGAASAQACYTTSVVSPNPLMGNHGEVFRTAHGALFEVVGSYEYLYAYSPSVTICPGQGKMVVQGRSVGVTPLSSAAPRSGPSEGTKGAGRARDIQKATSAPITVVLRARRCAYFLADGPQGYYLLEWYGGHDPAQGDGIYGDLAGYGLKNVLYDNGQDGTLYIDDYLLNKDRALEKFGAKCR
jgi:hypothetical protein